MYKKYITGLVVLSFMALGLCGTADATLNVEGTVDYMGAARNLIYDTDLNITWLDYSSDENNWANQKGWAENDISLTIGSTTYNNWRLPNLDELTDLFRGEEAWQEPTSPFDNLLFSNYWSSSTWEIFGTELYLIGGFDPGYGDSFWTNRDYDGYHGVAVMDGDVGSAPVPEPATILLMGTGIAGLAGTRLRKKKQ